MEPKAIFPAWLSVDHWAETLDLRLGLAQETWFYEPAERFLISSAKSVATLLHGAAVTWEALGPNGTAAAFLLLSGVVLWALGKNR